MGRIQCIVYLQTEVPQIYAHIIYLVNDTGAQSYFQEGLSGDSLLLVANGAINSFTALLHIKKLLIREAPWMVWWFTELILD